MESDQIGRRHDETEGHFVGRAEEMDRLDKALRQAIAGHGRIVMLAGEPGIGNYVKRLIM